MWESLNNIAQAWWSWQGTMLWQTCLLIGIVVSVDLVIRKWAWPQLRYALWLLVLVKLILPPGLASSVSLTAPLSEAAKQHVTLAQSASRPQTPATTPRVAQPVLSPTPPIPTTVAPTTQAPEFQEPQRVTPLPTQAKPSWQTDAMILWLLGVIGLSLALTVRLRGLVKKHHRTHQPVPDGFMSVLRQAAQDLKVRRLPQVVVSNRVCCPAVFGLFRPVLLIPEEGLSSMTRTDARHILLHELAHIARGDLWVHALNLLLLIVYWFNPLLWLMRKHLQNLRELCCDATVARHLKEDTPAYRETLIETAKGLLTQPVDPGLGLLGLFENSSWLLTRMQWLEKKTWRYWRLRMAMVTLIVLIMTACVLPMAKSESAVTGIVTDATTGNPIAGAKVFDDSYGDKQSTTTDPNGQFTLHTANEEHFISAQAKGYDAQKKLLKTSPFSNQRSLNFGLKKMINKAAQQAKGEPTTQSKSIEVEKSQVRPNTLVLTKPEYEWWLKESKKQLVIDESEKLEIHWKIDQKLYDAIDWFAVGVIPKGVDVSENQRYQWLAVDIPPTVRSTPYGKSWPTRNEYFEATNIKARTLNSGHYKVIVCGFRRVDMGLVANSNWRRSVREALICVAQAQLIVKGHQTTSINDQPEGIPIETYSVQPGDTLDSIGKKFQIPYEWIRKANIINPNMLRVGQKLKILRGPVHAKVYRSSCKLELWAHDQRIGIYDVDLGKTKTKTPTGTWRVKEGGKMIQPSWTDPETGQVFDSDHALYPLGERWIGLEGVTGQAKGKQGYAIHGVRGDINLGYHSTNGSIQMYNQDVIEVYDLLLEGVSTVEVMD